MCKPSSDILRASDPSLSSFSQGIKRTLDLCLAISVVVTVFPVLFLVALILKLESNGPVFVRELQYDYHGKPIWLFKFRTTRFRERESGFVKGQRSVALVHSILHRTGIEVLPQFLNVIIGDMSIVGPKPLPKDPLEGLMYSCSQERGIKPGIIDYADVNELRAEAGSFDSLQRRIDYDRHYVNNWSLWLDIKIILASAATKEALLVDCGHKSGIQ